MKLDNIRVVLVATTHPGNIGASCRAMKTMGLNRLYLVNPNLEPYQAAVDLASGADDILENAITTSTLKEALAGCQTILATSARPRDIYLPGFSPREMASYVSEQDDDSNVAIIFGREHAGLTNDELLHANYHIHIPSSKDFSSLNLSQAVQIICYELRMQILNPDVNVQTKQNPSANFENVESFLEHLQVVLAKIEFLKPENQERIMQKLVRLYRRAQLESGEVNILRGILTQIENSIEI